MYIRYQAILTQSKLDPTLQTLLGELFRPFDSAARNRWDANPAGGAGLPRHVDKSCRYFPNGNESLACRLQGREVILVLV
jgi:hypothetical protein